MSTNSKLHNLLQKVEKVRNLSKVVITADQPRGYVPSPGQPMSADFAIDFKELADQISPALCARIKAAAKTHTLALTLGLPTPVTTQKLCELYFEIEQELRAKAESPGLAGKSASSGDLSKLLNTMSAGCLARAITAADQAKDAENRGDGAALERAHAALAKVLEDVEAEDREKQITKVIFGSGGVRGEAALDELVRIGR